MSVRKQKHWYYYWAIKKIGQLTIIYNNNNEESGKFIDKFFLKSENYLTKIILHYFQYFKIYLDFDFNQGMFSKQSNFQIPYDHMRGTTSRINANEDIILAFYVFLSLFQLYWTFHFQNTSCIQSVSIEQNCRSKIGFVN